MFVLLSIKVDSGGHRLLRPMHVLEIRLALAIVVTEGQLPLLGRRRGRLVAGLETGFLLF